MTRKQKTWAQIVAEAQHPPGYLHPMETYVPTDPHLLRYVPDDTVLAGEVSKCPPKGFWERR